MYLPPPLPIRHFYILKALARWSAHGYAIGAMAENDSLGSLRMRDGTLYRVLKELEKQGLIVDAGMASAGVSGEERKHYAITRTGESAMREELRRYNHVSKIGQNAGLLDDDMPEDIRRPLESVM